jgi:hypothetical protein
MWQKKEKKTIFTLNVDGYSPEITAITYPLLEQYAKRIGAEFFVIKERKFPDWPVVYEKLQIYELAQEMGNDWNIYIDSDALVHPETLDYTLFLNKDTVAHNGADMANVRWKYDRFFTRDGRNIGSCNWFTIASDLCIELWKPLDDLTLQEALDRIFPSVNEKNTVITKEHLIDDFTLSRNIAKYGLKFKALLELNKEIGLPGADFFWHAYTIDAKEKVIEMQKIIKLWKI